MFLTSMVLSPHVNFTFNLLAVTALVSELDNVKMSQDSLLLLLPVGKLVKNLDVFCVDQ